MPLPGFEYHIPKRWHALRKKRWSSAFFESPWRRR
jgi:hypothetical protein